MKKTIFKTVFSTVLTGVLVSGAVLAFTNTVPQKNTNDIVTASEWNTIKTTIDSLKNSINFTDYYSKQEANNKFIDSSDLTACGDDEVAKMTDSGFICVTQQGSNLGGGANMNNYFTKDESNNKFIDASDLTACEEGEVAKMTNSGFICVTQQGGEGANMDNYFSKQESDLRYIREVQIPTIVMEYGGFKGEANINHKVNKPTCSEGYSPKIQVNLDWFKTIGDVNGDDIIGTWSVDKGSYWYVNGGDYDCGIVLGTGEIIEGCGRNDDNYNQSKISYTTYCTSIQKELPQCSATKGECETGTASNVNRGVWTCSYSGETENCGEYDFSDIGR